MFDWEKLPSLAPPEYLGHRIQTNSETEIQYYSSKLGLSHSLKRITPDRNTPIRTYGRSTPKTSFSPFIDPPLVRSEAWPNSNFSKSSKKRQWTRFKSNFMSCMKSVKCRFLALGVLLGLLLSLAAIIPIVVVWQTSKTASNSTSPSSSTGVSTSLNVSTAIITANSYFGDQQVAFAINMTIKSLALVITIQNTPNTTYYGTYNSYNTIINSTYTTTSTQIIYTFFLQGGQTLPAGNYTCNVQFQLTNVNHTSSNDQYSIQTTNICGITNSASGYFV